jgi:hypothetical protein
MFRELTNAYLTGAISYTEYFYKLKEGEVIREATTIDEERDNKETDKAGTLGGTDADSE